MDIQPKCRDALLGGAVGPQTGKGLHELRATREAAALTPPATLALQPRSSSLPLSRASRTAQDTGLSWVPTFGFQAPWLALAPHSFQASSRWHCHQGWGSWLGQLAGPLCNPAALARDQLGPSTQDRGWAGCFL